MDDDVAVVIATSGSSGYPKRVALSAAALVASATATEHAVGGPGRWVLAMPAHYVAGIQVLVRSVIAGTTPEILPGGVFSVDAFVDGAARAAVGASRTYTALVPAQVSRLLDDDAGRGALAAFDAVIVGGQAVPVALRDRAETEGVRLVRSYGSSETAGGCVYDGRPLDGVLVRLADGEIEIGGATLALGYLGEPERTAAAFREDDGVRWYRTGDAGSIDEHGVVDVFGRIDNVIVSGGVNVSLDRIEALVRERAGFGEAVVVGAEDARWGSVPVVVADSRAPDGMLPGIRRAAEESLGVAARPARIVRLDEIPMLATGKPDRRAIARLVARSGPGLADHGTDASTL
ncbi:o-succinylbenzoate--CoA ligase [Labedella phragmitis]|uniref:O-succinylbenzoate--CoA ligase n=1 Tax=Labedella phragmitis TaxID=2498849 RepID=A0A444PTN2_9MICO|nr:o-succinylbenzoate--CoA ligase [Labedella phragmitis]